MASRVYVRTHSLVLGSGGVTLVWCVSSTLAIAQFRVVPITGTLLGFGAVLASGTVFVSTQVPPWSGEETGYGWTELSTVLPDTSGGGDTPAGLYALQLGEGDLTDPENVEATAYFVLRRRTSTTKMVVCYPFSTLAAYATPVRAEAVHTSTYNSYNAARTRRVSLDRPFNEFAYGTDKLYHTLDMALRVEAFARTLFGDPTDVDVCTSFDLDGDPNVLAGEAMHLFVSAGHDEYWSKAMRDKVAAFVAAGNNAAFFSANTFWWQVRFEDDGRTMVCFKAGIEDPLVGVDDAQVTGNPAASPVNTEENLLTGVSYRRGTQWKDLAAVFTIRDAGHPYLAGVAGTTFGAGTIQLETDAAAFDTETNLATGVDGSPLNFTVLATVDARREDGAVQRGWATLGVYTNVGTVFTAATTHWASGLSPGAYDADIAAITANVLQDLVNQKVGEPAWTLPTRVYPTSTWTSVATLAGSTPALAGVVEGFLVMQRGNAFYTRDPENPSAGEDPRPAIKPQTGLRALGADLYGRYVYCAIADTTDKFYRTRRTIGIDWFVPPPLLGPHPNPWRDELLAPAAGLECTGIAGHNWNPYVSFRPATGLTDLWRLKWPRSETVPTLPQPPSWDFVGRVYPPVRSITSLDGVLYGVHDAASSVSSEIPLYARQAADFITYDDGSVQVDAEVDLVWTRIGSAPSGTRALAAYYGRLYALSGLTSAPTLSWRAAVADAAFPYRPPSALFFDLGQLDAFVVVRQHANGDVETTGQGNLGGFAFTHATRANDGIVFFYDSASGAARVTRIAADGTVTVLQSYTPGSFGTWTHVVYVRAQPTSWTTALTMPEYVFFYRTGSSTVVIGQFDPTTGVFSQVAAISGFGTGWQRIAVTHKGDMLFYNPSNANAAWGRVGSGGTFSTLWTTTTMPALGQLAPVGNRCMLSFQGTTLALLRFDTTHELVGVEYGFGPASTRIVPFANGTVLLYDEPSIPILTTGKAAGVVERTSNWLRVLRDYPATGFVEPPFGAYDRFVPLGIL